MSRVPDFLIIGAQKAASTYLQFCLSDHPDIWMPLGETLYFEDPDYEILGPGYLGRRLVGRTERVLGIKRPPWIGRDEVPPRICQDLSNARLIAVLRNPVDRSVSAYYYYMRGSYPPILNSEIGLTRLLDQDPEYVAAWPRAWKVLKFSCYHTDLTGCAPFFERGLMRELLQEDVRELLQEDVIADALGTARSLYEYLGVDEDFNPERMTKRPQAVVYELRRLKHLQAAGKLTMRKNADGTRSIGYRNKFAHVAYRAWRAFDGSLLDRLAIFYEDDIMRLEETINRDLSRWRAC